MEAICRYYELLLFWGVGGGGGVPGYVLSRFSFTATRRADVTTDAEIMVSSLLRTHSYQKTFYFKPRVGQNIALRASPSARIAPFLFSAFPVHSVYFPNLLQSKYCSVVSVFKGNSLVSFK